jgi:hypothetical protein
LQELIWPSISPPYGCFNFYELRELWWIDSYYKDEYSMDALITFLKLCPSLEQLFVTVCFLSWGIILALVPLLLVFFYPRVLLDTDIL